MSFRPRSRSVGLRRPGHRAGEPAHAVHLRRRGVLRRRLRLPRRGRRALGRPACPSSIDDISRSIGARVAERVPDGATLQLGIGAVPDASVRGVAERRGLKIWSEMVSDGVLTLHEQRRTRPRRAGGGVLRLRLAAALRVGRPQPERAAAAHRDDQRPGADLAATDDGVGQRCSAGGPIRAGQRVAHQQPDLLRLRRADRLRRGGAALQGRAGARSRCVRGIPRRTCRPSCR